MRLDKDFCPVMNHNEQYKMWRILQNYHATKGQLISERNFGVFKSSTLAILRGQTNHIYSKDKTLKA